MCFRAVKYLSPRQSYWLYLIHPLSCLPPNYIDYSSMSWLRSKMAAALPQWRCYSLIAIWDFSLCGALGLLCLWQMLSYVHELSYKPMMCFPPSSPLRGCPEWGPSCYLIDMPVSNLYRCHRIGLETASAHVRNVTSVELAISRWIQWRHSISAPVRRMPVCDLLYNFSWIACQKRQDY